MFNTPRHRRSNDAEDSCPMTPEQIDQLLKDVADIKKYMFAGRVVFGTLVFIGFTFDWIRDHINFIKAIVTTDK